MVNPKDNRPLTGEECINLVKETFHDKFRGFKLIEAGSYTSYWWLKYEGGEASIFINGDERTGFSIEITIDGQDYQLWQYEREVNQRAQSNRIDLLFQLSKLAEFLKSSS